MNLRRNNPHFQAVKPKTQVSTTLYPHEWITAIAIFSFFLALAKIAWHAPDSRWPQEKGAFTSSEQQIVVHISGALGQEGRYHFPKGTTLGQAVDALSLNSEADVSNLDLQKVLRKGEHVKIGKKKPLRKKCPI